MSGSKDGMRRRDFLEAALIAPLVASCGGGKSETSPAPTAPSPPVQPPPTGSVIFHLQGVPDQPFTGAANHHAGVDGLLQLMGRSGLKLHRSATSGETAGPHGLIAAGDVVLVKVNAQWKYRGCTNSDVVRGLIQCILEHPDGFTGEVVIIENGQGRGSLRCDTSSSYGGDASVRANANDESHSFIYLVEQVFNGRRVSATLLDPIRSTFIGVDDHVTNGYRRLQNVSYPCFNTAGGRRVELFEGVWTGSRHEQNLKLINVPVLKHHDTGGSEITGAVKHFYGLVSMSDGNSDPRHYATLGETCGRMIAAVRPPALNVMDAIWVSHKALGGFPASATFRANQLLASQDPVALDYWSARSVLFPVDSNPRHSPDYPGIDRWLADCMNLVNSLGGISRPDQGIHVDRLTKFESDFRVVSGSVA
jgi:uncharacterized protein (DUF362 family)